MLAACATRPAAIPEAVARDAPPAEAFPESAETGDPIPPDRFDKVRNVVGGVVNRTANRLDRFFGNPRVYQEHYDSYAQLDLMALAQQNEYPAYRSDLAFKLALPYTQNRWNVVVESDTKKTEYTDGFVDDPLDALTQPTYRAGLRYVGVRSADWNFTTDGGVEVVNPPDVFLRARLSRAIHWPNWSARFAEEATGYGNVRRIATTSIDVDRLLRPAWLFRASTELNFTNIEDVTDWRQSLNLFHQVDLRRAMQYQIGVQGSHTPFTSTSYFAAVRHRQQLERDWTYLEWIPLVEWNRDRNFEPALSLQLRYEIVFRGQPPARPDD
jgi:hypothetical protein